MRTRPWAMGCHLPYGITQYYLPPDTSECVPPQPPRFTYPGGMEGWVDLAYPAVHRPGVELAIFWWQVRRPNHYTTEPPKWRVFQCLHLTLCYVCIMSLAVLYIMFYINSQFTYLLTYLLTLFSMWLHLLYSVGQILQLSYVKSIIADFVIHNSLMKNVVSLPASSPNSRSLWSLVKLCPLFLLKHLVCYLSCSYTEWILVG